MNADSDTEDDGQPRRWRRAAIASLLAIELTLWVMLRSKGWFGTLDTLGWFAAFAVFALPCAIAVTVLGFRSRRFSLRSMLIATGLAAVFLAFFLLPYVRARGSRLTVQTLKLNRVGIDTESSQVSYYESLGLPYDRTEAATRGTPVWISPLLSGLPATSANEIVELGILLDEQVPVIVALQDELPNLRTIRIFGLQANLTRVTASGLDTLSRGLSPIESLSIIDVAIPEKCCQRFAEIRHLSVIARDGSSPVYNLTESQLRDIASTPGLEILTIGQCNLDDAGAAILAGSPNLRHLDLIRTRVTAIGRDKIEDNHPRLTIHLR